MKKSLILCFCLIIAAFTFQACGPNDVEIQGNVKKILMVDAPTVNCMVRNGVVTLNGTVTSDSIKSAVAEKVQKVEGAKSLVNDINVVVPKPEVKPEDTLRAAITKAIEDAKYTGIEVAVDKDLNVTLKGKANKADQKKIVTIASGFDAKNVNNEMEK